MKSVWQAGNLPRESAPPPQPTWPQAAVALYSLGAIFLLARLALGYLFTVRLVRASRAVERPWAHNVYESAWISVPPQA